MPKRLFKNSFLSGIGGLAVIAVVVIAAVLIYFLKSSSAPTGIEVNWETLGNFDYINSKSTSELQALDGQSVKIPGFMVPLEDNQKKVSEFLLVPNPQACIHVPPPPSNQMIYMKSKGEGFTAAYGPIWVYGVFHLTAKKHYYGESSFSMEALYVEPYR